MNWLFFNQLQKLHLGRSNFVPFCVLVYTFFAGQCVVAIPLLALPFFYGLSGLEPRVLPQLASALPPQPPIPPNIKYLGENNGVGKVDFVALLQFLHGKLKRAAYLVHPAVAGTRQGRVGGGSSKRRLKEKKMVFRRHKHGLQKAQTGSLEGTNRVFRRHKQGLQKAQTGSSEGTNRVIRRHKQGHQKAQTGFFRRHSEAANIIGA